MKQIIYFCIIFIFIGACSNENKKKLDPTIKITGTTSALPLRSNEVFDSLAFITRYAWEWGAISKKDHMPTSRAFGLGTGNDYDWLFLRDTLNNKLLLTADDVIYHDQLGLFIVDLSDVVLLGVRYNGKLIHAKDCYTVPYTDHRIYDTIGYIPNKVILEARKSITKAFEAEDYIECQRLFNEAYIFKPTTGEKWRAMKAAGIE